MTSAIVQKNVYTATASCTVPRVLIMPTFVNKDTSHAWSLTRLKLKSRCFKQEIFDCLRFVSFDVQLRGPFLDVSIEKSIVL